MGHQEMRPRRSNGDLCPSALVVTHGTSPTMSPSRRHLQNPTLPNSGYGGAESWVTGGTPIPAPPPKPAPCPWRRCAVLKGRPHWGSPHLGKGLLGTHRRRGREIGCLMNVSCVYGEPASYDNPDVSCLSASAKSHLLAKSGSHHDAAHRGFNPAAADLQCMGCARTGTVPAPWG